MAYEIPKKNPIDQDPDIIVGLSFPLNPNSSDFDTTVTTIDQARHNLRNLLLTMKGERPFLPNFGTNLHRLIFEQNIASGTMVKFINTEIRDAVEKWLPYIGISQVNVTPQEDQYRLGISISYVVSPSAANQTIELAASGETGAMTVTGGSGGGGGSATTSGGSGGGGASGGGGGGGY
tara:strand:+ start:561 stop:1094 length:534 start_codon:yes stop_codon:yes gene_type:complete